LFVITLLHEYGHTFGTHLHGVSNTPRTLRERGWAVEDVMFGGRLEPSYGISTINDYRRIEDLLLTRDTLTCRIREFPWSIVVYFQSRLTKNLPSSIFRHTKRFLVFHQQWRRPSLDRHRPSSLLVALCVSLIHSFVHPCSISITDFLGIKTTIGPP
jgi:hypothetical protein